MMWQENRATTNNVFGLLLPQSDAPSDLRAGARHTIARRQRLGQCRGRAAVVGSGRLRPTESRRRCRARTDVARAERRRRSPSSTSASAAADAFLTVLAADEAVRAAARTSIGCRCSPTASARWCRTSSGPGADQSRAEAELAVAKNQLSQAVQIAEIARASLAEAIGAAGASLELAPRAARRDSGRRRDRAGRRRKRIRRRVPGRRPSTSCVRASGRSIARIFPQITLQSAFAGRGTGADAPGCRRSGTVCGCRCRTGRLVRRSRFPAFDIFSINARKRVEAQNELAEQRALRSDDSGV